MPSSRARSNASKATPAGSAPACLATTSAPTRSPQTLSWSIAAARNVSAAASITLKPRRRNRCAILPMVVVLPVPFTPTTRNTCGLAPALSAKSCASGSSTSAISDARMSRTASASMPSVVTAACDPRADARGHGDAEIGLDQHLFQPVEHVVVELPLGDDAREIVRQCARGAGEPRAELVEPAPSWLGHGRGFGFLFLALAGRQFLRRRGAGRRCGAGGRRRRLGRRRGFAGIVRRRMRMWACGWRALWLGRALRFGGSFLGQAFALRRLFPGGRSFGGSFLSGPLPGGSRLGGGGVSMGFGASSPTPNSRLKKLGFLMSLMAQPSRAARRRHRPRPRRRSARPLRALPRSGRA